MTTDTTTDTADEALWPSSPLAAAARAFALLTAPPTRLEFRPRGVRGLRAAPRCLPELRDYLLDDDTPPRVRDQVWRILVRRARGTDHPDRAIRHHGSEDGDRVGDPAWVVVATGMAVPGLLALARRLGIGLAAHARDDLDSVLIEGFLTRLRNVDLHEPRLIGRLLDAAQRAGEHHRDQTDQPAPLPPGPPSSTPPEQPWGHPDLVLHRAVRADILTRQEAHLIGTTRLEDVPLTVLAPELGLTVWTAGRRRAQAEDRLVEAIRAGDLAPFTAARAVSRSA